MFTVSLDVSNGYSQFIHRLSYFMSIIAPVVTLELFDKCATERHLIITCITKPWDINYVVYMFTVQLQVIITYNFIGWLSIHFKNDFLHYTWSRPHNNLFSVFDKTMFADLFSLICLQCLFVSNWMVLIVSFNLFSVFFLCFMLIDRVCFVNHSGMSIVSINEYIYSFARISEFRSVCQQLLQTTACSVRIAGGIWGLNPSSPDV